MTINNFFSLTISVIQNQTTPAERPFEGEKISIEHHFCQTSI